VSVIAPGADAPPIPGLEFGADPLALFFYKVTCPVCQLAAPKVQAIEAAYPGRIAGIGQDPPGKLAAFAMQYGDTFPLVPDLPPYAVSDAYGIRVVPTLFLVASDGSILLATESWDREGFNAVSAKLADLTGRPFVPVSTIGDGLPPFRPG
jgi:peroxiredoxin